MKLAEVLARVEGVRPCGRGYVARCPGHEDRNASLSIREGEGAKLLLNCFAGCSFEAIRDALGGRPWRQALGPPSAAPGVDDAKRTELALRIWRESKPAPGTLVERYLHGRAITIPPPASLRFHQSLKHPSGGLWPAMVACVQDADGRIVAIHRTFLKPSGGGKAEVEPEKMALGPILGGAVRLAPAGATLCLAEGLETALSVLQATGLPTWAALGTSNLSRVQLPSVVRDVIICADADAPGERAARQTAARFMREARRVRIAKPHGAKDFNDRLIA